jgi:twinkle protein
MKQEATFLHHISCTDCGSSDALGVYSDGHTFCFSCGKHTNGNMDELPERDTEVRDTKSERVELIGELGDLPKRRIREDTCKLYGYRVGEFAGKHAQFAYYYDDRRRPIAAKVRFANKDFKFIGDTKAVGFYGDWLCRDGGKMLVVTEGEIDALTVSQLQGNKWPAVSVPNGAQGASKAFRKNLEWLEKFETVVIMFDMDEPGQLAATECADLLTPGKVKIATLPLKDANECLQEGRGDEVISAIWGAKVYRPDGIISGTEITRETLQAASPKGYTLRYPVLSDKIGGLREGELTMLTAGSGIGKSTLAREIAYGLHQDHAVTVGNIYLEEGTAKTAQGYIAIHNDVSLGDLRRDPSILTDEQWDKSLAEVIHQRMYFYDHFGSLDSDHLLSKINYMKVSLGCNFVILDHISIVISGNESSGEGERRDIDMLMTKLRSLVERTGVGIIAIVHLSQPKGKSHEEGGRVTLSQLRGSGSLKQLSDNVIALERDQQNVKDKNKTTIRILKCREFGDAVGIADVLEYTPTTGRLLPVGVGFEDETPDDEKEDF